MREGVSLRKKNEIGASRSRTTGLCRYRLPSGQLLGFCSSQSMKSLKHSPQVAVGRPTPNSRSTGEK